MSGLPWRETAEGVELAVRLTPRARTAGCDGVACIDGRPVLRLRVAAPPVEGAANAAVCAWLAMALGVARRDVELLAGDRGRVKRLRIRGQDLPRRLAALVAASSGPVTAPATPARSAG